MSATTLVLFVGITLSGPDIRDPDKEAAKNPGKAPPPGQEPPGRDVNAFQRLNPHYKQRAGGFYEEEYLGPASRALARATGLPDDQHKAATGILRQFIYEWLDGYVRGGGEIARDAHRRALKRMDDRFRKMLTAKQFQDYLRWRQGKAGENALNFLMRR